MRKLILFLIVFGRFLNVQGKKLKFNNQLFEKLFSESSLQKLCFFWFFWFFLCVFAHFGIS